MKKFLVKIVKFFSEGFQYDQCGAYTSPWFEYGCWYVPYVPYVPVQQVKR